MNWNEKFAREHAGKVVDCVFYRKRVVGRVVGFSNDKNAEADQKVLCVTDQLVAESERIAHFLNTKRSYTQLGAPLDPRDRVFTFHKWDLVRVEVVGAAPAPSNNPDAKAWQDAWNTKFKTYNRMTSFLANLPMRNFPIELERERREIVNLAMKEIDPKAVENDAKAFNEFANKIKDR